MSDLLLDTGTNDLVFVNGDLQLVTGQKAVAQSVKQSLLFFSGEWFLDTTKGIPYYQEILVKDPNMNTVQALIQNAILAVDGVLELTQFQLSFVNQNRKLSILFSAKCQNADIINSTLQIGASPGGG